MRIGRRITLAATLALSIAGTLGCAASGGSDPRVAVSVDVDFGPSGRGSRSAMVLLPKGGTPSDALAQALPVVRGFVCCTRDDVWSVDGVATDPEAGLFWLWHRGGQPARLPADRHELGNGDHVRWVFAQGEPPSHRRH